MTQRDKSSRHSSDIFLTRKVGSRNLHHLWDALCIEISARMEGKVPHKILLKEANTGKEVHRKITG